MLIVPVVESTLELLRRWSLLLLLPLLPHCLHDVINAQKHARSFNSCFQDLNLVISGMSKDRDNGRTEYSTFTLADSYKPYDFMSTILPVSPLIPHECSPFACLA